jgi:hypothetical protein
MMHPALVTGVNSPGFRWYGISLEPVLPRLVRGHHKFVSHDLKPHRSRSAWPPRLA